MSMQVSPIDQNTLRRRGTGLRVLDHDRAFPGYTLFTPLTGQGEVYLIDLDGKIRHQWTLPYRPGLHGYLLPNGNLFYGGKGPEDQRFFPVWSNYRGGILAEVDPQGTILWEHRCPDHHHDALAQQHYPYELPNGNLLIFDNGAYRHQSWLTYSRVIEVSRQTKEIVWAYVDKPPQNFFSSYISSAPRLPNGNTLIAEGAFGRIFEVTKAGETVWEYVVPHFAPWQVPGEPVSVARGEQNAIFRALRYAREEIPWL